MIDLYALLQITPNADVATIKAALNTKREQLSPKEIKAVEEWLLVPEVRLRYDARLREQTQTEPSPSTPPIPSEKPKIVPLNNETANDDDYMDLPPMWNPKAALWAAILLNVVVASVVHAINWKNLGEEKLAKENKMWAIAGLVGVFTSMLFSSNGGSLGINIGLVLAWYFSVGKKQVAFFEENFNNDYEKRSWLLPVLYTLGGAIALAFVATILASLLGLP